MELLEPEAAPRINKMASSTLRSLVGAGPPAARPLGRLGEQGPDLFSLGVGQHRPYRAIGPPSAGTTLKTIWR
jgi:hypothetical protein